MYSSNDVPPYSSDIATAWALVEQFSTEFDCELGFVLEHHTENAETTWVCTMPTTVSAPPYEEMDPQAIVVEADTAAHAICLGVLSAYKAFRGIAV
jgi:hypothetical protein